jgi:hypothetical protein
MIKVIPETSGNCGRLGFLSEYSIFHHKVFPRLLGVKKGLRQTTRKKEMLDCKKSYTIISNKLLFTGN